MPACAASASSDHAVCGASCMAVMARAGFGSPVPPAVRRRQAAHPSDNAATGSVATRTNGRWRPADRTGRAGFGKQQLSVGPRPGKSANGISSIDGKAMANGLPAPKRPDRPPHTTAQRYRRGRRQNDATPRADKTAGSGLGNQQIFMHGRTRRNPGRAAQMDIAMRRRVMMLPTEGAAVKKRAPKASSAGASRPVDPPFHSPYKR